MKRAIFSWSGGKDSSYALHRILLEREFHVVKLSTTLSKKFRRISMHGVCEELLEAQAASIGVPLEKIFLDEATNLEYERQVKHSLRAAKEEGIDYVIYGDIFLQDLRDYGENLCKEVGIKPVFPIWKTDTKSLVIDFMRNNFKAITCCVSDIHFSEEWAGRELNNHFFSQLPATVDPCGEHGEYHSFCYDGPIFNRRIEFQTGDKVWRSFTGSNDSGGFWFCNLIPISSTM